MQDAPDIRILLQSELVKRCRANPRYSLRAFARTLEIESSALSKILSGKRAISPAMLRKIGSRLALNPVDMELFASRTVERRGRRKNRGSHAGAVRLPSYSQIALDHYQSLSEWYHFAILELVSVEGFALKPEPIARALGISRAEASAAVERLIRLGWLEIDSRGRWWDRAGAITNITPDVTSAAQRKIQQQILTKAIVALDEVPLSRRDNTGMTMAVDSALLPEAKRRITRFRRELCEFLQSNAKRDAVYQLSVALYPLTGCPLVRKKKRGKA